jgi:hypothetical protein
MNMLHLSYITDSHQNLELKCIIMVIIDGRTSQGTQIMPIFSPMYRTMNTSPGQQWASLPPNHPTLHFTTPNSHYEP